MKAPTKPPSTADPPTGAPASRSRKNVAYTPSVGQIRAEIPAEGVPAVGEPWDASEDFSTPARPQAPDPTSVPTRPAEWQPSAVPLPTGPYEVVVPPSPPPPPPAPLAPPPPPPAPPSSARNPFGPPPSQALPTIAAMPSGHVRRATPVGAPPYSSGSTPISAQVTGPQLPLPLPPVTPRGGLRMGQEISVSRPIPTVDDGVPLGYIVASAFFLAIALVGFGLYLAFEVISL